MNKTLASLMTSMIVAGLASCGGGGSSSQPTSVDITKEQLGEKLFADKDLSLDRTQSCATCHDPEHAFIDFRDNLVAKAVSVGDNGTSLGDRNTPTAMYGKFTPNFQLNSKNVFIGGQFLDGRERDLKGQAGQPPLNPVEMNMPDKASVVARLQENAEYVDAFKVLFGTTIFDDIDSAYAAMTESIGNFEKTDTFSPFNSKYDRWLINDYDMTPEEDLGRAIFFSQQFTNCNGCHQLRSFGGQQEETFTNYEYHNLGIPVNQAVRTANNNNGKGAVGFIDHGLLDNPDVNDASEDGKFKVPTLRNVAVTGPYMHNGVFQDLRTVVLFYDKFNNTSRVNNPETGLPWRAPEVNSNLALETSEFNARSLTDERVGALVAFMKLLTDQKYEHLIP